MTNDTAKRIEVEFREIDDLKPYKRNAKRHPPEQVEKLKHLIIQHGWLQPIVIDGTNVPDEIVAGHGRRLAALKIKAETGRSRIPVRVLYGYSPEEIRALRLADNRVTSTEYDTSLIRDEIADLIEAIDMNDFGFDEKELEFMTADLAELNEEVLVEDVGLAVENQKTENEGKVADIDSSAAPIADAFGFKRCTVAESRQLRAFTQLIEHATGKKGAAALIAHFEETVQ